MTYLAVPISGETVEEAFEQIQRAGKNGAEMLELRTDYLSGLSVELVRQIVARVKGSRRSLPLIVTCRDKMEGGARDYPLALRLDVLAAALDAGADFIDFESENYLVLGVQEKLRPALSRSRKGRLILSAHNFQGRFPDIGKLYRHILAMNPAAIPKLVYKADHINDCFEAFDLLRQSSGDRIVLCMGHAGLLSRLITKKLGGFVTFASIHAENATAPGQITVKELKKLYRWDNIKKDTLLYGVIGSPVAHSASPAIHNAGFDDIGENKLYVPLLVDGGADELARFFDKVIVRNWLDFRGFSVTIPHKTNALEYVKSKGGDIEPMTRKIGAVNTVLLTADGDLRAYNTDYAGAMDAITETLGIDRDDLNGMPIAVIGAGGVSRAIVAGLCDAGADITIYNRTLKKAAALAEEFGCRYTHLNDLPEVNASLLINCTSIGMHPDIDATPVPAKVLNKNMAVFDTVYNPAKTMLLKIARAKRAKTIDGVSMFVNQAMAQFRLFTGKNADVKKMRRIVIRFLVTNG